MIEKVNPSHPDKIADRIAGAIVDMAYAKQDDPKIAVEVLIGHNECKIIAETSVELDRVQIASMVHKLSGCEATRYLEVPQDAHLAANQAEKIKCGDNGIFKGMPTNPEEETLSGIVRGLYEEWPTDGKFIYDEETKTFIACQSNAKAEDVEKFIKQHGDFNKLIVNPLGDWTGGINVDTGATNRKLGSDMGRGVTGGGLHGKDLSKADVSINIWCYLMAKQNKVPVEALCAIGDEQFIARTDGEDHKVDYAEAVAVARDYINGVGGFEKFAEWGLI